MSIISNILPIKEYFHERAVAVAHVTKSVKQPFLEILNDGRWHVYGIVILNKIIGRIILFTNLEDKDLADGKEVCYISNLWVHPKMRGKKIGSKLVRFVEKEAKKSGFEFLTLGVHKDNEKNMSIYSHMGFDKVVKSKFNDVVVKDENGNYITVKEYTVLMKKL